MHPRMKVKHPHFSFKDIALNTEGGPFVYRLGRKIFILERGVRFPHGLHNKQYHEQYEDFTTDIMQKQCVML